MKARAVERHRAATVGIAFGHHRPRIHPTAFITEGTYVIGRVTVGRRASIWFGAVLRGDFDPIRVGEESLIEPWWAPTLVPAPVLGGIFTPRPGTKVQPREQWRHAFV